MSNASQRNFGAFVRERDRRVAMDLDSPGNAAIGQAAYLGPGWDAFYGSLHDQAEAANANGMGYRVDMGAFGRDPGDGMQPGGLNPLDQQSLQRLALSRASDLEAQRRRETNTVNDAVLNAQQQEQIDRMQQSYDRNAVDTAGAQAVQAAPDNPAAQRAAILQQVPPHVRVQLEKQFAGLDLADREQKVREAALAETVRGNKASEALQQGSLLPPAAIDDAALLYNKTGQMPTLGQRDPNNRQRILARAAELARGSGGAGADIAANKADYKADSGSQASLQKQRDAIGAFEKTAMANIDVFLKTAGKVVDTGSPFANTIARVVSGKMLGSPDQAKYDAARQVAINEVAKIVSNPTLSGTLSDSARHEVEAFNPANATLAQTVAVMRLLKNDMANRTKALDETLGGVRQRIAATPGGGGGGNTAQRAADLIKKYGGG